MICSIEGCEKPVKSRGWCVTHYGRWYRLGDPESPVGIYVKSETGVCSIDGCTTRSRQRGWCATHYSRWRKHGDPLAKVEERRARESDTCSVEGCDRPFNCKGMRRHHYRVTFNGEHRDRLSDYYRTYAQLNADKIRAKASKRRARKRAATVARFTEAEWMQRVVYYGSKCWICREAPYEEIDHVKPLSKGGPHMLSNLRPACSKCNNRKLDQWPFAP